MCVLWMPTDLWWGSASEAGACRRSTLAQSNEISFGFNGVLRSYILLRAHDQGKNEFKAVPKAADHYTTSP